MKYYIAYKFTWNEINSLKENLSKISNILEKKWNSTFIYHRDIEEWWKKKNENEINKIMEILFENIDNSDRVFAFIDNENKSEWMLIELWYAKAKNKKIIVAIKQWIESILVENICEELIIFEDIKDLCQKIELNF